MPSVPRESSPGAPAAAACHPEVPSSVLAPTATAAASSTWSSRKGTAPAAPAPPTHTRRVSTGTGARRQSSNSADGRAPARRRCLLLSLADLRPLMPTAELRRETRTLKCHLCPAPLVRAPIRSAVRLLAGDTHALAANLAVLWPRNQPHTPAYLVIFNVDLGSADTLHLALEVWEKDEEDERETQLTRGHLPAVGASPTTNEAEQVLGHARMTRVQALPAGAMGC